MFSLHEFPQNIFNFLLGTSFPPDRKVLLDSQFVSVHRRHAIQLGRDSSVSSTATRKVQSHDDVTTRDAGSCNVAGSKTQFVVGRIQRTLSGHLWRIRLSGQFFLPLFFLKQHIHQRVINKIYNFN